MTRNSHPGPDASTAGGSHRNHLIIAGRLGAMMTNSTHDVRVLTAPGRAAFMRRFELEVDPELEPAERARRAELKKKIYFTRLALKSAKARAKRSRKNGATAMSSAAAAHPKEEGDDTADASRS